MHNKLHHSKINSHLLEFPHAVSERTNGADQDKQAQANRHSATSACFAKKALLICKYSRLSISRTRIPGFCEIRSVYLNKKYILIGFFNHNLALDTFLQVQITRSAY